MITLSNGALLKRLSILLVASHSLTLGTAMLFAPGKVLVFLRWPQVADLFFVSQTGIFLVILGFAYLAALWHEVLVWMIVGSKLGAVLFLFGHGFFVQAPFQVILAGVGDACLGLLVVAAVIVESRARSGGVVSDSADVGEEHTPAR